MKNFIYRTLPEAVDNLKERGYVLELTLRPYCLESPHQQLELGAYEFEVDEIHGFQEANRPNSCVTVYAISTEKEGKGLLIDSRGSYANCVTSEMARKLKISIS